MENPNKPTQETQPLPATGNTAAPPANPAHPDAPKRNRGRPPVIDQRKRDVICALVSVVISYRLAAAYVGVSTATVGRLFRRDPNFNGQFLQAMLNQQLRPLQNLIVNGERSWRANAWLLEHLDRQRWGKQPAELYSVDDFHEILRFFADTVASEVRDPKLRRRLERRLVRIACNPKRAMHAPNRRLQRQFQRALKRIEAQPSHADTIPVPPAHYPPSRPRLNIDAGLAGSTSYNPDLTRHAVEQFVQSPIKKQRHPRGARHRP